MKKPGFHTNLISTEFESFNTITFRQDSKRQKMIPDGQKREKTKKNNTGGRTFNHKNK